MFFKNYKVWETELAGRKLTLETGKMCGLAGASIMARYGDTNVLCNVTMSAKPREGVDFFPLSVDYEEKMYSVGRIPGSFQRREARPSEKAILTSRCIDRPIRPLFPKDMRNDVSVVATVMSVDPDCSPEITAMIGVSAAIAISDIPWDGPISGVNVGLVDGQIVINPTLEQRAHNDLNLTVASTGDLVAMIEAGGNEIDDDTMFNAIMAGHEENKKIIAFINGIVEEVGKPKKSFQSSDPDPEILQEIEDFCIEDVKKALDTDDKNVRDERLRPIYDAVHEKFDDRFEGEEGKIEEILYLVQKHVVRAWLKDEHKRVDIVPTFLGAHAVPQEYNGRTDDYVDFIIREVMPAVVQNRLAEFCDVFCEQGVFSIGQSRRLLTAAREMGLALKLHADEIVPLGGAGLAAELSAVSADHLLHASDADIRAMADKGVVATLLPLTAFALKEPYARGREMIDAGCAVALATDLNPGSCFSGSIPLTFALACIYMKMSIEEAITALTLNGAAALNRADSIGSIEVGKKGDFVVLNTDNYHFLPYYVGMNCVHTTVKEGVLYPVL